MLITLEQSKIFEVKASDRTVCWMEQKSEWNGMLELQSDSGETLIVGPTGSVAMNMVNQLFGKPNAFQIIRATPSLLEKLGLSF